MYPRKERSDFAPKKIAAGDTSLLKKSETSGTSRAPSPTNGENTLFVCRGEQFARAQNLYKFRTVGEFFTFAKKRNNQGLFLRRANSVRHYTLF